MGGMQEDNWVQKTATGRANLLVNAKKQLHL